MTEYRVKGRNDWLMGSDLQVHAPIRDMSNPRAFGQPQTMSEYMQMCGDNGGVHYNSGIPNYAFYRMTTRMTMRSAESASSIRR
ncbi:M4 family metallopeptidase [Streptomyces sp. NPDC046977]|uniref:M4 family metallopeptidase n=1 Tax=Streptomyces sp. NPDC046977 TaxID=3154703 RepID=UPI0033CC5E89